MEIAKCIIEVSGFILTIILLYKSVNPRYKTQQKDSRIETKLKDLYKCPVCESVYQDYGKYGETTLMQANGSYGDNVDLESIISKNCRSCNKKLT